MIDSGLCTYNTLHHAGAIYGAYFQPYNSHTQAILVKMIVHSSPTLTSLLGQHSPTAIVWTVLQLHVTVRLDSTGVEVTCTASKPPFKTPPGAASCSSLLPRRCCSWQPQKPQDARRKPSWKPHSWSSTWGRAGYHQQPAASRWREGGERSGATDNPLRFGDRFAIKTSVSFIYT